MLVIDLGGTTQIKLVVGQGWTTVMRNVTAVKTLVYVPKVPTSVAVWTPKKSISEYTHSKLEVPTVGISVAV